MKPVDNNSFFIQYAKIVIPACLIIVLFVLGLFIFALINSRSSFIQTQSLLTTIEQYQKTPSCDDSTINQLTGLVYFGNDKIDSDKCGVSLTRVNVEAIEALKSCRIETIETMKNDLKSKNSIRRRIATRVLGEMDDESTLKTLLTDDDDKVRQCANFYIKWNEKHGAE